MKSLSIFKYHQYVLLLEVFHGCRSGRSRHHVVLSYLNPIEHLWAPCTHALSSVYLRSTLEGEAGPPRAQARLFIQEKQMKEHMVFNTVTTCTSIRINFTDMCVVCELLMYSCLLVPEPFSISPQSPQAGDLLQADTYYSKWTE